MGGEFANTPKAYYFYSPDGVNPLFGYIVCLLYTSVRSVRNASLKQNTDFANVDAFLKEIENERRREFAGEGLRWMDMRLSLIHI